MVGEELERNGVRVLTSVSAKRIEQAAKGKQSRLSVIDSAGGHHPADLVIFAGGVRPNSDLAHRAGVKLGANGAIAITRRMETNLPDVFAAGDCVETYHRLLDRPTYISLGTIAHKQGRVAGENAIGGDRQFPGALGTQSIKVFNIAVARTGLLDHEARSRGFDPLTAATEANDHNAYYPGAVPLHIFMSGDRATRRLLGAQIIGLRKAEISKRIDIVAAALFQNAAVEDLDDMDLSYTPPFSSPWDPISRCRQSSTARPQCVTLSLAGFRLSFRPTGPRALASDGQDIERSVASRAIEEP
jgi:NADPH-dependent 2,4-dienoyl-CoA reductase/sulfur reductase-like enzyme